MACASAMTELVAGKSLERARSLRREDVIEAVGGVPQASIHAAQLAIDVLSAALRQIRLFVTGLRRLWLAALQSWNNFTEHCGLFPHRKFVRMKLIALRRLVKTLPSPLPLPGVFSGNRMTSGSQ